MTEAARKVLKDCRDATGDLVDGIQGGEWRRRWILAVVLLRAVGHVLAKVDGARSDEYKNEIKSWWTALKEGKPNPDIFWEFIEEERNTILKEYSTKAGQGVKIYLGNQSSTTYHYTINSGPFKGQDQRCVLDKAISWWESELDRIDQKVQSMNKK
ncbi:hypothetical protein [Nitrosomonas sp.]|uniref:hypothetical protein n=1 Tax=Nitrosomonas sp. TaxID=42353 RepID=UPI002616BDD5|nr:hypothetical protein [Nitrosomonas sp.]